MLQPEAVMQNVWTVMTTRWLLGANHAVVHPKGNGTCGIYKVQEIRPGSILASISLYTYTLPRGEALTIFFAVSRADCLAALQIPLDSVHTNRWHSCGLADSV